MTTVCDRFLGGTIEVATEQLRFRPSVYGLVLSGNKILLLKYKAAVRWTLPGGAVEKGERIEAALCREIKEEAGLTARGDEFLRLTERFFYYDPSREAWQAYLFYYRCTPLDLDLPDEFDVADDATSEPRWVDIQELTPGDFQADGEWLVSYLTHYLTEFASKAVRNGSLA